MDKPLVSLALSPLIWSPSDSRPTNTSGSTKLLLSLTALVLFSTSSMIQGFDDFALKCASEVRCEATQASGVPILVTITLTNKGDKAMEYPSLLEYSNFNWFKLQISDARGKVREVPESNQPRGAVTGGTRTLEPGKSVDLVTVIDPLPVGIYKIQIGDGKSVRIIVKDDPQLLRTREQDLLSKIRKGDLPSDHVVAKYLSKSLVDALLQDLLSNDDQIAERAAYPLLRAPKLPDGSVAPISKAMDKHLAAASQQSNLRTSIFRMLADLAAKVGSDEALEPVIKLARTDRVRREAVWALGQFKQDKAAQQLRLFLKDESEDVQFEAARTLSQRKDPAALPVLLRVAKDPKSRGRAYAIQALMKYPDDPRVQPAIKSGLDDPDSFVRQTAEITLRDLARQKNRKP
jgi:hypothetical protein